MPANAPSTAAENSLAATIFRNPFVAVAVGVVLPLVCLALDPIVFRDDIGSSILGSSRIFWQSFIALSVLTLLTWLLVRRCPSLFCGLLAAGFLLAFGLGIILLPMSLVGIAVGIGILGLSPFLTAATFFYCATDALRTAGDRFKPFVAVLAFVALFALAGASQVFVPRIADHSMKRLADGRDESTESAMSRLKLLGPLFNPDQLVQRYIATDSQLERERIATAYRQLTGDDIQRRAELLLD